jgi:alpha-L-fucosidase
LIGSSLSNRLVWTCFGTWRVHVQWESAFTIDSHNWGYARNDNLDMYLNISTILHNVVSTVAFGGNVLVNIGPTHDGRIATIFQERLLQMGEWLSFNGEAIYKTTKWRVQNDTAGNTVERGIYYTASKAAADVVYAISMSWPTELPGQHRILTLTQPVASESTTVSLLVGSAAGSDISLGPVRVGSGGRGMQVPIHGTPVTQGPWVFKLSGVH